jgi:Holliday junction DNA helicase RuvB
VENESVVILEDPEVLDALKNIVAYEEECLNKYGHVLYWEWQHVGVHWLIIRKLLLAGFLEVVGGRHKAYRLRDREAVKRLIQEVEETKEAEEKFEETFEVPEDLFSPILGYDDVKQIIINGLKKDRPTHFLFVGPSATAKSLFLEQISTLKGSSYHLGSSSSKAGLTQFLLEYRPRILLIDEFDKMKREDYAVLLSLMESGKVVETKYGRRHEEYMNVWVIASCNTLKNIPPEVISRFRPFIFHFREYNLEEFKAVVKKFLTEREGVSTDLAEYIAEKVSAYTRDVRAARGLARHCKTKEEVDKYIETLTKYKAFLSTS